MTRTRPPQVEVYQGNATLRGLMTTALDEAGFESTSRDAPEAGQLSAPEMHAFADLAVVDVDSELGDVEPLLSAYRDAARPVLICGLRASREGYADAHWLSRPFSPDHFIAQCMALLDFEKPPASAAEQDVTESSDDSSDTQRLSASEAERLEEALGLQKGKLRFDEPELSEEVMTAKETPLVSWVEGLKKADKTTEMPTRAASTTADAPAKRKGSVDDTDELSAEELEEFDQREQQNAPVAAKVEQGGEIAGEVERHRIDAATLATESSQLNIGAPDPPAALRSNTLNSTLPDVPAIKLSDEFRREDSQVHEPQHTPAKAPSSYNSTMRLAPRIEAQIQGVSVLLADNWGSIGRSARPGDRAEHIEKILRATFAQGLTAAAAEVDRIPAAPGFSGQLASMSVIELIETVRDRGLRGRVELSIGAEDFVLYLDAQALDQIENLSGNDDQLLLDVLAKMGCLSAPIYAALQRSLGDELAPPLQMQLRDPRLIEAGGHLTGAPSPELHLDADDLREARRLRALHLFRKIRAAERNAEGAGNFAFMAVFPDGAHAWPVDALGLNVDELLELARREDSRVSAPPRSAPHQEP